MQTKQKMILRVLLSSTLCLSMATNALAAGADPTPAVSGSGTFEDPTVTVTESTSDPVTDPVTGNISTTTTTITEASGSSGTSTIEGTVTRTDTRITDSAGTLRETSWTEAGEETKLQEPTGQLPTVTVTLKPGETTEGTSNSADTTTTGDTDKSDSKWDYTTVTRENREATANTGEISVSTNSSGKTELIPVNPPMDPYTGEEWEGLTEEELLAKKKETRAETQIYEPRPDYWGVTSDPASRPEGYDFQYTGLGQDSYLDTRYVDEDGDETSADTLQFVMKDLEGNIYTAYCVDLDTSAHSGWWYRVDNLESGTYYPTEESENHIRAIVNNGYWGTNAVTDAEGNQVATGSLEKIKQDLKAAITSGTIPDTTITVPVTDADGNEVLDDDGNTVTQVIPLADLIDDLTEGEALNVTQAAIWTYANGSTDVEDQTGGKVTDPAYDAPDGSASEARMEALYQYLIGLTEEAGSTTEIINEDKFIKEMSLTIGDKLSDGTGADENGNPIKQNVYDVSLNFALVVTPSDQNDDLIVTVIDASGNILTQARLAGESAEGEAFGKIYPDADGTYTLSGLQLAENRDFSFDLKLEGTQYLEKGVYVYTSERRAADTNGNGTIESEEQDDRTSQTFVGIAEGLNEVDVGMNVTINFSVEDALVETYRSWRDEGSDRIETPGGDGIVPGDDDDDDDEKQEDEEPESPDDTPIIPVPEAPEAPLPDQPEETPQKEDPTSEIPATGDLSPLWFALTAVSGSGLAAVVLLPKKEKES